MRSFRFSVSTLALLAGAAWSSGAQAGLLGDDAYISVFGGYTTGFGQSNYFDDIYDQVLRDGFVAGIAVGSHVGNGLRVERELSYVRQKNDKTEYDEPSEADYFQDYTGYTSGLFLLTNVWKDFDLGPLRPYAGGGLGIGYLRNHSTYNSGGNGWNDTGLGLAAQLGAGARLGLSDRLALDFGYRLRTIVDATFDDIGVDGNGGSANSIYNHSFQLGMSYALNGSAMPAMDEGANWYASLFGGAALPDNAAFGTNDVYTLEGKTGFTIGAAVGTELADNLRGELELSYLQYGLNSYSSARGDSDPASGDVRAGFILANVWKDFDLGMMRPYVGGGLGFALADINDGDFDGNAVSGRNGLSFAGQFGFGARFDLSDRTQIDVGYRFKSVVEAMIKTAEGDDYDNAEFASHQHVLQLGLTHNFGGVSVEPAADLPDTIDNRYISLFAGVVVPLDTHIAYDGSNYIAEFKTGFLVGAAIGGDISNTLRGEVELSHYSSNIKVVTEENVPATDTGENVSGTFLMANLWRDVELGSFTPYFGGGVGMALMDVDIIMDDAGDDEIKDTSLALAAQIGGGIRVPVSDNLTIDAGYRFKGALGVVTEGGFGDANHGYASYYAHVGQIGASWRF